MNNTYILIYLTFVLLFVFLDAMVCLTTKYRFDLKNTIATALFFPIAAPIFIWFVAGKTKNFREFSEELGDDDED